MTITIPVRPFHKDIEPMSLHELMAILGKLDITQAQAANYLGVNERTFRRWVQSPEEMTGPAREALRSWSQLHKYTLPWRPNEVDLGEVNPGYQEGLKKVIQNHITETGPLLDPHSLNYINVKPIENKSVMISIFDKSGKGRAAEIIYPFKLREIAHLLNEQADVIEKAQKLDPPTP